MSKPNQKRPMVRRAVELFTLTEAAIATGMLSVGIQRELQMFLQNREDPAHKDNLITLSEIARKIEVLMPPK